jgi:iron complex transport system substrate-binding protein
MKKHIYLIAHSICLLFLVSCTGNREKSLNPENGERITENEGDRIVYAQGFQIETHPDYTLVTVRNPWNTAQVLHRYVLVPKSAETQPAETADRAPLPEGTLIRTPLERTASYGSVQCSFFAEFDALSTLVGVCEPQYINIPFVRERVANGSIADLGAAANPNTERILSIEPEAIFASPLQDGSYNQEIKLGIPFIECMDYMESSPLGRAEWIRFYGLFFDERERADSLFTQIVNDYNRLKTLCDQVKNRPAILVETIYNGIWYLPGGNSYMAHLFRDAEAKYLWEDDTNTGSIGLSFEAVLDKAEKADYWLIKCNSPNDLTYKELAKNNLNYTFFEAYTNKHIYICNTRKVLYYEELPIHPDFILKDMVRIFHPELLPNYQLRYYEKMKD